MLDKYRQVTDLSRFWNFHDFHMIPPCSVSTLPSSSVFTFNNLDLPVEELINLVQWFTCSHKTSMKFRSLYCLQLYKEACIKTGFGCT